MNFLHRLRRSARRSATLLGVLGILAITVVAVLVLMTAVSRDRAADARAREEAASYTPAPLVTPGATRTPANSGPVVAIIGDDYTAGPTSTTGAQWTTLLQKNLGVQVVPLAADSSGYLRSPALGAERTFSALAAGVPENARLVLFVGGGNDTGESSLAEQRAVVNAVGAARTQAPQARVVIAGPLAPSGRAPASLGAVRDSIRTAATASGARFVDPIARDWFSEEGQYVGQDGVGLSAGGQRLLATRVGEVVRSGLKSTD